MAFEALLFMQLLPAQHFLYLPQKLSFWRTPVPLLRTSLGGVFRKVVGDVGHHTGMAIGGARGAGKTHFLKGLVLVTALLLPYRVISSYIDFKSMRGLTPAAVLFDALACAPTLADSAMHMSTALPLRCSNATISHALAAAGGRVMLLATDEIECVYLNDEVWTQLHSLATKVNHCLLEANSGSMLEG